MFDLYTEPRAVDVIAVYQQSGAHSTELLATRQTLLWDGSGRLVEPTPQSTHALVAWRFQLHTGGNTLPMRLLSPSNRLQVHCDIQMRDIQTARSFAASSNSTDLLVSTVSEHIREPSRTVDTPLALILFSHAIACVDKYAKEYRPQHDFPLIANQVSYHLPLSSSIALTLA